MIASTNYPALTHRAAAQLERVNLRCALAACQEYFEEQAAACAACKGRGAIPEQWLAHRLREHPPRIGACVGLGFVWHDCQACRKFRDLAAKCRGVKP